MQGLHLAIEQQLDSESVVQIPLNSANPLVHNSLGTSYPRRFERFGAMKDIDSAVEQQLRAAASVPPTGNSIFLPYYIFRSLGDSFARASISALSS